MSGYGHRRSARSALLVVVGAFLTLLSAVSAPPPAQAAGVEITLVQSSVESQIGTEVVLTATVMADGLPQPSGFVNIFKDGVFFDDAAIVAGVATYRTTSLPLGDHSFYVDAFILERRWVSNTITHSVTGRIFTLEVEAEPTVTTVGGEVDLYGNVSDLLGPVSSEGAVEFQVESEYLGIFSVNSWGTAIAEWTAPAAGIYQVYAIYYDDSWNIQANSEATILVEDPPVLPESYESAEGEGITIDASELMGALYSWDLNNDGIYEDAYGAVLTLTWDELIDLGIDNGPARYPIELSMFDGEEASLIYPSSIQVANTGPDAYLSDERTAIAGESFTIYVGATDPSPADMAALFEYTIDWGDGSAVDTVEGPADPPVSHTYAEPGTYTAIFTATDRDGDSGAPAIATIVVTGQTQGGGDPTGSGGEATT
ncbi:MAG: PKD domain-containing protein, partial [Beutenbergiaceae bacterium]